MTIMTKEFSICDYLGGSFECSCGHVHSTALREVIVRSGALEELPGLLQRLGFASPMIICDNNTAKAAGDRLIQLLRENGIDALYHVINSSDVVPDERTLGELMMAHRDGVDVIIPVGTGTLNDLGKFMSHHLGLPYIVVATAPSMDGFASIGAALITNNLKTTYDAHVPLAIVGDVDILRAAPINMISAGLGDILGKNTCLADWKLAHIINGEYYCPVIAGMVEQSIEQVAANSQKVLERDAAAVACIMEALVLTGIAMSFSGNSRPASGSEHHISHYWEMMFLFAGRTPVLHGTKVGVGTVLSCFLYSRLRTVTPDFAAARCKAEAFDFDNWCDEMRADFLQAADGVIKLEQKVGKNSPQSHAKRIECIERNWDKIIAMTESVPEPEKLAGILESLGAPALPRKLEISPELVRNAIIAAKEVRDRYTILQMLWDLGIAEEMAKQLEDWLAAR